jgi:hypothetical protein
MSSDNAMPGTPVLLVARAPSGMRLREAHTVITSFEHMDRDGLVLNSVMRSIDPDNEVRGFIVHGLDPEDPAGDLARGSKVPVWPNLPAFLEYMQVELPDPDPSK